MVTVNDGETISSSLKIGWIYMVGLGLIVKWIRVIK